MKQKWRKSRTLTRMRPYARVVYAHKEFLDRTGLTAQALATVLRRSPKSFFPSMARNKNISVVHCNAVDAPVWQYTHREDSDRHEDLNEAKEMLRRFPWPRYKGVSRNQGTTTLTGFTLAELTVLRKAAKGYEPVPDEFGEYLILGY